MAKFVIDPGLEGTYERLARRLERHWFAPHLDCESITPVPIYGADVAQRMLQGMISPGEVLNHTGNLRGQWPYVPMAIFLWELPERWNRKPLPAGYPRRAAAIMFGIDLLKRPEETVQEWAHAGSRRQGAELGHLSRECYEASRAGDRTEFERLASALPLVTQMRVRHADSWLRAHLPYEGVHLQATREAIARDEAARYWIETIVVPIDERRGPQPGHEFMRGVLNSGRPAPRINTFDWVGTALHEGAEQWDPREFQARAGVAQVLDRMARWQLAWTFCFYRSEVPLSGGPGGQRVYPLGGEPDRRIIFLPRIRRVFVNGRAVDATQAAVEKVEHPRSAVLAVLQNGSVQFRQSTWVSGKPRGDVPVTPRVIRRRKSARLTLEGPIPPMANEG